MRSYLGTVVLSLFLSLFLSIFAYVHDRERVLFPPVLGPLFGAQESAEKNYWQLEWQQLSIGTIAVIVVVNENVFLQKEVFKRGRTLSNVKFFKRWKPQNSNDGSKNNNDCEAKGNASFNVQVWHVKFVEIFFSPQRLQIGTLEGGAPTLFGNFAPREQGRTAPAIGGKRRNLLSRKQLLHFCLLLVVLHSSNQVSRGLSTLPGTTNTTAKSSQIVQLCFGLKWKTSLLSKNCCTYVFGNFWKHLGYYLFQHHVTLAVTYKLGFVITVIFWWRFDKALEEFATLGTFKVNTFQCLLI